jgi:hypothetical protein
MYEVDTTLKEIQNKYNALQKEYDYSRNELNS